DGAVLLSGLIAMIVGTVTEAVYHPHYDPEKRGFKIEVAEEAPAEETAAADAAPDPDIATLLASADAAAGQAVAKKCVSCHSFEKGGANKVGPNLWNIVGNKLAHSADFAYSKPMATHGGAWNYDELN